MTIKAIAFDLDGTIVDTESFYFLLISDIAKKVCSIQITRSDYDNIFCGRTTNVGVKRFAQRFKNMLTPGLVAQFKNQVSQVEIQADFSSLKLFPSTQKLLLYLQKKGFPIAIVSSTNQAVIARYPTKVKKLLDQVNVLVTGEQTINSKPAPDSYLIAATKLGVSSRDMLIIEDADVGILAGLAAGSKVIGVNRNLNPYPQRIRCYPSVRSLYKTITQLGVKDFFNSYQ